MVDVVVHTWDESVGDESSSILFPPAGLTGESVSEVGAPLVSWLWLWLGSAEVSLSNVPAENFFFCSRKFRRELRAPPPPPPPPPKTKTVKMVRMEEGVNRSAKGAK